MRVINLSRPAQQRDEPVATSSEIRGWYSYSFGADPFGSIALLLFAPLIIESLAAQDGYEKDHLTRCNWGHHARSCDIQVGPLWMATTSFQLYITSIATLLQALFLISIASFADYGSHRKQFICWSAVVCATCSLLLLTVVRPGMLWFAVLLYFIASMVYGASGAFAYAYLPILSRNHPRVLDLPAKSSLQERIRVIERTANTMNSHSIAWTMLGCEIVLAISFTYVYLISKSWDRTYAMQVCVAFVGVWWLLVSFYTMRHLKSRPGPPLPTNEGYLLFSWKRILRALWHSSSLSHLFRFLFAWTFQADASATISTIMLIFAKTKLGVSEWQMLLALLLLPICSIIGTYFFLAVQRFTDASTRQMVILTTILFACLPLYAILGFKLPFGLVKSWEYWLTTGFYGFIVGAFLSFNGVLFSELVPKGRETEFFGLYEITDKGSAWIGPFLSAVVTELTGDLRYAFVILLVMMVVPVFILMSVNVIQGRLDAEHFVSHE